MLDDDQIEYFRTAFAEQPVKPAAKVGSVPALTLPAQNPRKAATPDR